MSTAIDAISIPTREELVSRARGLQPLLREHAAMGDTERKASDAAIDAVTAAGFFRLLSPRQFGGYEADVRTVLEISELLGQADGSVAWLVGLGATATWLASHFSDRARSEVFADNGDARIAGAATPGPARRVDGGLRVSGRWAYASGCPHATWAGIVAIVATIPGSLPTLTGAWCPPQTYASKTPGGQRVCAAPAATPGSARTSSCPTTEPSPWTSPRRRRSQRPRTHRCITCRSQLSALSRCSAPSLGSPARR